jgi:16S rRNA (cytidine1402-2'-O)-methyltransferase
MATLYIVATPIGNLEDITLRALRVLRECDAVLCEDTRVTSKLLTHYDIKKPLVSYHAHSGGAKYEKVFGLLTEGATLCLVSDAGTPTVSDPGARLVREVREKFGAVVHIEAVPGPSAITAALSIAGIEADAFSFLGFPPHKKGRETFFTSLARIDGTVVFYESPHRIEKALGTLTTLLPPHTQVTVVREITKMFEEVVSGNPHEVQTYFLNHQDKVRGEFVVLVSK